MIAAPTLADRIFRSFPAGSHGLPALLRIAAIVETDRVPTAAVSCSSEPVMYLNPAFVEEHAATGEKLLMLVMHELHHVLLGHARMFPRVTPLDNLAFDAVINAMLCGMFPEPEHVSFFTDFYDDRRIPACFLRPAPDWKPGERAEPPRALRGAVRGSRERAARLAEIHAALYSSSGVSYDEIRAALLDAMGVQEARVPLLGDHSPESEGASSAGALEHRAPALFEAVREAVERWPRPPQPVTGRSSHDLLEIARLRVPVRNDRRLAALLRRVAGLAGSGRAREARETPVPVLSPRPRVTRRGMVLRALGWQPLLHEDRAPARRVVRAGESVHVYLDVSGSIGELVAPLAAAILSCGDRVHRIVHLFSDDVADVTLGELRRGVVRTTGGTSIECVARHAREHRIGRAVIVTDGFVGKPSLPAAEALADMRIGVALVPGFSTRADLEPYVRAWTRLEVQR